VDRVVVDEEQSGFAHGAILRRGEGARTNRPGPHCSVSRA
jgi:hypothetical protein